MNRRNVFVAVGAGIASLFVRAVPAVEPMKLMHGQALVRLSGGEILEQTFSQSNIDKIVRTTMSNMKFSLPDGTFAVFPGLTEADDLDTIWTAASSG